MRVSAEITSVEILTPRTSLASLTSGVFPIVYAAQQGEWMLFHLEQKEGLQTPSPGIRILPGEFVVLLEKSPHHLVPVMMARESGPSGEVSHSCLRGCVKWRGWPDIQEDLPAVLQGAVGDQGADDSRNSGTGSLSGPVVPGELVGAIAVVLRTRFADSSRMTGDVCRQELGPGVVAAMEAIRQAPGRGWTLSLLAEEVGMSRSSLAWKFRNATGRTLSDYLLDLRMNHAETLMKDRRHPLKTIAGLVGYRSASAFSIAYKRWSGKTPSQVRRPSS